MGYDDKGTWDRHATRDMVSQVSGEMMVLMVTFAVAYYLVPYFE